MNRRPNNDSADNKATVCKLDRRHIAYALLAILGLKLVILLLDPNPRFFLWDSVTYLRGAIDGTLPRDRSFLYSLLIGAVAVPLHSLHALSLIHISEPT